MCVLLDINSLERGNPLVVSRSAHYGCNFIVEVVCDNMMLLSTELDDFVFVDYAGYRLYIA